MRSIVLIVHNVRSAHNTGSLLRTADGLGIDRVYFTGYSPYPIMENDERLPHIAAKVDSRIRKTALGAETTVAWQKTDLNSALDKLTKQGFTIAALEQTGSALNLSKYKPPDKIALLIGNEVSGLDKNALSLAEIHLQIPMLGRKESFNVAAAAAMALYHLRFTA